MSKIDENIKIKLISTSKKIIFKCDKEQLSRVFLNLIKNSIESIQQKAENIGNFDKNISIEIKEKDDHIIIIMTDNGVGFKNFKDKIEDILHPYFTTKKNGTGIRSFNS